MQNVIDTLRGEDSLLAVADKHFGVLPLRRRMREIIYEELPQPPGGCDDQLAVVLLHPPTIWAAFLAAVSNELRPRAQQPSLYRLPQPARRRPWTACIEWQLLQRLWAAERRAMVAQAIRTPADGDDR